MVPPRLPHAFGTALIVSTFAPSIKSAEGSPDVRFTVAEVHDDVPADAVVGARRSGMLCTPAGRLVWRAVAPERRALVRGVSLAARDAGLSVKVPSADDFDEEVRTPFRITVTIEKAHVSACVPWMGLRLGKQPRQRATGEIETVWRVFDQRRRFLVAKASFCTRFKYEANSPDLSDAVLTTMMRLTSTAVRRLKAGEPLETRPEQAGSDSAECEANEV